MSMNAEFVIRQGKKFSKFGCYQTPTKLSYQLQASKDPVHDYKLWCKSFMDPIEFSEHSDKLDEFVKEAKDLGLRVEVEIH